MKITPELCRAARGLLRWTQERLASEAGVSPTTIRNFERGRSTPRGALGRAITGALESRVEFIEQIEGVRGHGVCLKWGVQPECDEKAGEVKNNDDNSPEFPDMNDEELAEFKSYWSDERLSALSEDGRNDIQTLMDG